MKKVNESGRSMVEMLGVLAIIGVLSVGGIMGYARAMQNWRANEIIEACNRLIVVAETENVAGAATTYASAGFKTANVAGGIVDSITFYPATSIDSNHVQQVVVKFKDKVDTNDDLKDAICEKFEKTGGKLAGYTLKIDSKTCQAATTTSSGS